MAVTSTATIPQRLAETLVVDTTASATPANDVFSGVTLASKIYVFKIDNSGVNGISYFKGQIASTYSDQNPPDIRLYAPANSVVEYTFPSGWPANELTGSDKFSFIGTSTAASTGTQVDPLNGSLKVTLLGGT
tara:strand:+ start:2300 stop:2698 length:399 start_codon:yes stop_codon:yes gene_type:complete